MAQEDRTVGRVFATPDGREYRPSMFLTLTMPSYGAVTSSGVPVDPSSYNYRRQALDALHFARLVDRFWQNLRRAAGYKVQYFAAVEPQRRLVPHLHAAIRGAIPRQTIRQVVAATYLQLWWPSFDRPVYVHRTPVWDGESYVDADTGQVLPTWAEALDQLERDPDARAAHVMRFGRQVDMAGIIAPSSDADRAVRYLTKYLTKAVADTQHDPDTGPDPAAEGARRPAARRAALPPLLRAVRELAALRHPTRPARPRPRPRPLPVQGARPRTPRPRPPRPRLPPVVREDAQRPQGRPRHRRPRSPPRRRHRRPRHRTARRHRHPARRVAAVRVDRHPPGRPHLRPRPPGLDRRTARLARAVPSRESRRAACGQPSGNHTPTRPRLSATTLLGLPDSRRSSGHRSGRQG